MPGSFFDTNVLIYLASADDRKASRAEALIAQGGTISVQVLNEVANVARRKMGLKWEELDEFLGSIRSILRVVPVAVETHEAGLRIAKRYGLSIYDAMVVAAAAIANCDVLWSEDMQHGLVIDGGPRIRNPFVEL